MIIENSFAHTGKVASFKLYNSDEGNLRLKVKTASGDLNLEAFVYGETSAALYRSQFKEGDIITVLFKLLADERSLRKLNRKIRHIVLDPECQKNPVLGNIYYIVHGQVIQVNPDPNPERTLNYVNIVLDCGIYLGTIIPKSVNVKVGDYLQLDGRLDAHIVGRVE